MDPVPREVKIAFHVFGGICFVIGLVHSAMAFSALECVSTNILLGKLFKFMKQFSSYLPC